MWHHDASAWRVKNTSIESAAEDHANGITRSESWIGNGSCSSASSMSRHAARDHEAAVQRSAEKQKAERDDQSASEVEQVMSSDRGAAAEGPPSTQSADPMTSRHDTNKCVPCVQLVLGNACSHGNSCSFCHLSHQGPLLQRPSKELRKRCKILLMRAAQRHPGDEESRIAAIQELLSRQNNFMRNYTIKILMHEDGGAEIHAGDSGSAPPPAERSDDVTRDSRQSATESRLFGRTSRLHGHSRWQRVILPRGSSERPCAGGSVGIPDACEFDEWQRWQGGGIHGVCDPVRRWNRLCAW
eukprot:TRINITY_DN107532_c0_g1_i1.p1 TRINITY_DN107532_c0_g1~~TRINITY_DN107532_c0_g1_i1.p1  ORF type:complete len:299 (+),score=37.19 TRINITY_DN107532_c0_g1_i1:34-930(+)